MCRAEAAERMFVFFFVNARWTDSNLLIAVTNTETSLENAFVNFVFPYAFLFLSYEHVRAAEHTDDEQDAVNDQLHRAQPVPEENIPKFWV